MVAVGLTLLLGLALYLGLTLRLRRLSTYYLAIAATLGVWASSIAFWNSYTVILPILVGALGSILLALAGLRAAWRAHAAGDAARAFWLAGVVVALTPFGLMFFAR
jgi:hypothetical protein